MSAAQELGILVGVAAAFTLLAELLGAENLGTALTVGQIAFIVTALAIIVVRRRDRPPTPRRR